MSLGTIYETVSTGLSAFSFAKTGYGLIANSGSDPNISAIIDPLTTVIQIAMICFQESGTKIIISDHSITYQPKGLWQSFSRTVQKNISRNNLLACKDPILRAAQWYNPKDDANVRQIFHFATMGLRCLKETYQKNDQIQDAKKNEPNKKVDQNLDLIGEVIDKWIGDINRFCKEGAPAQKDEELNDLQKALKNHMWSKKDRDSIYGDMEKAFCLYKQFKKDDFKIPDDVNLPLKDYPADFYNEWNDTMLAIQNKLIGKINKLKEIIEWHKEEHTKI